MKSEYISESDDLYKAYMLALALSEKLHISANKVTRNRKSTYVKGTAPCAKQQN